MASMAPSDEGKALAHASYWDNRYTEAAAAADDSKAAQLHEWFRSFQELEPFFQRNLIDAAPRFKPQASPLILHLGSGDSVIPVELAARGYPRQLCVDFSTVVVQRMSERHASTPGIEWRNTDVRAMTSIADCSVDVAFDKGTLDAMIHGSPWSPPGDVKDNTSTYLREVHRVLKDDGVFLYVTFRQPHFIKPLLNPEGLWDLDMQVLGEEGSFDYYGFVVTKKR
ncbi:S-adenosyl-L-methionine-dependent methyltransferase [Bombardia bombarda]|uniref:S-adenosyl-L-methionine-dependent methyltransferase n=1 Tax=Bombardia bombarda TaxID=252184 RepID=A0AA39X8J6_9PEZI|nr:S-adenosyl-L-methionine-dependent methyltransferase [Bombardia bombarda]